MSKFNDRIIGATFIRVLSQKAIGKKIVINIGKVVGDFYFEIINELMV